ncbi:MAG: protein adenylyltransferase SelO [bacterium]
MKLSHQYASLGEPFCESIAPSPCDRPELFLWNDALASQLQIPQSITSDTTSLGRIFSGCEMLPGSKPVAMAYAGHQFGNFVPQLGDGRAHLLGEIADIDGNTQEIQLKGSGQSRYSRNGDGRCAMGPAIREFIMSEAMHALGIPTTRSLAVTTTGEAVYREQIQPGAVVTRIASSHLRVGTFEYFAARDDHSALVKLADFAIQRHYPDLAEAGPERFIRLLERVIDRQIDLITHWLRVGFIHGVMNTDNTAISGETIDFGPCAMMGNYDPDTVFSSIDHQGRYAYGNQPSIAQWNMARFAETLLPLLADEQTHAIEIASEPIAAFPDKFKQAFIRMMNDKLGLTTGRDDRGKLIFDLLDILQEKNIDYTITFDQLTESNTSSPIADQLRQQLGAWFEHWQAEVSHQGQSAEQIQDHMRQLNPLLIPRNHHVERVLQQCIDSGEPTAAEHLLEALRSPYSMTKRTWDYQDAPEDNDRGYRTFCGT